MPEPFLFLIASLATFRLSRLFSQEEGPLSLFRRARREVPAKTNAGRGVRCPFCLSVWFGSLATAYLWWLGHVPAELMPLYGFALSGASVFIHTWQAE